MSNTSEYEELTFDENEAEWEGDEDYEEEPSIYYSEDFISGPMLSKESTLPGNILEFEYPFFLIIINLLQNNNNLRS